MALPSPLLVPGGQLPNAITVLFTVNPQISVRIESVMLVNTDVAARTFNLYLTRFATSTTQRISPKNCNLDVGSLYETGPLCLFAGDVLKGDASVAAVVDYTITAMQYV